MALNMIAFAGMEINLSFYSKNRVMIILVIQIGWRQIFT